MDKPITKTDNSNLVTIGLGLSVVLLLNYILSVIYTIKIISNWNQLQKNNNKGVIYLLVIWFIPGGVLYPIFTFNTSLRKGGKSKYKKNNVYVKN
tara:strand:- start:311 stop:595 length:285 start_codon:yes stop_codon:yes gene_type:complete